MNKCTKYQSGSPDPITFPDDPNYFVQKQLTRNEKSGLANIIFYQIYRIEMMVRVPEEPEHCTWR